MVFQRSTFSSRGEGQDHVRCLVCLCVCVGVGVSVCVCVRVVSLLADRAASPWRRVSGCNSAVLIRLLVSYGGHYKPVPSLNLARMISVFLWDLQRSRPAPGPEPGDGARGRARCGPLNLHPLLLFLFLVWNNSNIFMLKLM